MIPFTHPVRPENVAELIDLTVEGDPNTKSMASLQLDGIAALYNILCEKPFAYLADEVGMGKTYQALGLAALLWNEQPNARILFLSPRQNLQIKWLGDYKRFFASNYRRQQGNGDDRVASVLFGEPLKRPVLYHNLRGWSASIGNPDPIAPFLRHTSFTRPIYLHAEELCNPRMSWERARQQLRSCGMYDVTRPEKLPTDNPSLLLNLTFAQALNGKLSLAADGQPYFDLVIIDEAQCLRHPENQTNQVLFEILKGQVRRWLFMSATPAHGGPRDLPTVLNHYPECGEVLKPELVSNLPALQDALQAFLVRRQRKYRKGSPPRLVGKDCYRKHERSKWSVRDEEMSVLETLSMGLVQKGLDRLLQDKGNRYRIGFLSSFESLDASVRHPLVDASEERDTLDEQQNSDFYHSVAEGDTSLDALDSHFISKLATEFTHRFGRSLPHPKIDSVVNRVAPLAYGTASEIGGQKFLVFTRRVSTVETLKSRFLQRHQKAVEERIKRCWGEELDWSGQRVELEEVPDTDEPSEAKHDRDTSPFRQAMSQNGWLYKYRQTFRNSGRNALFFEDAWLERLCVAGGRNPRTAATALPDEVWAESWTHASRASGDHRQQFRAHRMRYLALHALRRFPQVFGLTKKQAAPWQSAYEAALHEHLEQAKPDSDPHHDFALFDFPTLWAAWDKRHSNGPLALPGCHAAAHSHACSEDLCRRQVLRTVLGQNIRLSDTLIDLFYADKKAGNQPVNLAAVFLDWFTSPDPAAKQLQQDCTQWITHLRLIVDSSLDGAGRSWRELARAESWPQLFNPEPVMGVTGGSGAHRVATQQFRTPSHPRIIVCTDTLKEGVDLHLFCDQVLHYGVAWTSGDLEQRVGRVDRFFSQIERRLHTADEDQAVNLAIGYPHVASSLEHGQVERVIERLKQSEQLMNSPLAMARQEEKEIVIGSRLPQNRNQVLEPYGTSTFPSKGCNLVRVSQQDARRMALHYERWYQRLRTDLSQKGWALSPAGDTPSPIATLHRASQGQKHEMAWSFDATLKRHVITISSSPWAHDEAFSGGMRTRRDGRSRRTESFLRLLVPTPQEGQDAASIFRLLTALDGQAPEVDEAARATWGIPLEELTDGHVKWLSSHKAEAIVQRRERSQRITIYAYKGGVRLASVISPLDQLEPRSEWGREATLESVRNWAYEMTNALSLGYIDVHIRDGLVFGNHVIHGNLTPQARLELVKEVAWRADAWEAELTGADRW